MAGIFSNFMPAVRNNSTALTQAGIGLLSGQTPSQQAALGAAGFAGARQQAMQKNQTLAYLQKVNPQLAQAFEQGLIGGKEVGQYLLQAQMPKDPYSTIGKLQADLQAGRITQDQYNQAAAGIGKPGVSVNVNNGNAYPGLSKLGEGFTYRYNPDGSLMTDEQGLPIAAAVPGGKADLDAQASARKQSEAQSNMATQSDVVTKAAQRARDAAGQRNFGEFGHSVAAVMPWTDSAEVSRQVQVLKSQATIENLNAMRRQSETGGALGNVTEGEGRMLAAKAGALDPNSPNFLRDLDDYELTLLRVIHGYDAGTQIFMQNRTEDQPQGSTQGEGDFSNMSDQELMDIINGG